jgi:hypothetical protein
MSDPCDDEGIGNHAALQIKLWERFVCYVKKNRDIPCTYVTSNSTVLLLHVLQSCDQLIFLRSRAAGGTASHHTTSHCSNAHVSLTTRFHIIPLIADNCRPGYRRDDHPQVLLPSTRSAPASPRAHNHFYEKPLPPMPPSYNDTFSAPFRRPATWIDVNNVNGGHPSPGEVFISLHAFLQRAVLLCVRRVHICGCACLLEYRLRRLPLFLFLSVLVLFHFSTFVTVPLDFLLISLKDLALLTAPHPAALLPSSDSPNSTRLRSRPPTPSVAGESEIWSEDYSTSNFSLMKAPETSILDDHSPPPAASPLLSPKASHSFTTKSLTRSASEGESSFRLDVLPTHSFARPPKVPPLPDPSQFPDPYPQRSPYSRMSDRSSSTLPPLSSEGSSSASTRSSAYTSSGSALASNDYSHVQVATGDDREIGVAVGITSDDVVQVLQAKSSLSSSAGRTPIDQTRWSEYSASIRSRSSSIGINTTNSMHESGTPRLRQNPSFDMGWQTVDERDEVGLTTDDETDDLGAEDDEIDDKEDERTSAAVVAEEGRGLIVKGESIVQLRVEPGECEWSFVTKCTMYNSSLHRSNRNHTFTCRFL